MKQRELRNVIREEITRVMNMLLETPVRIKGIDRYIASNGKPRGRGHYWFYINDKTYSFSGLYRAAVKQAMAKARELGVDFVELLP